MVGYASLLYDAASTTVAYHDMTAVRRAYRGRGIAGALKRATIAWAIEHGLEALDTGNDDDNAPMRAVNLALGYRPARTGSGCRDRSPRKAEPEPARSAVPRTGSWIRVGPSTRDSSPEGRDWSRDPLVSTSDLMHAALSPSPASVAPDHEQ